MGVWNFLTGGVAITKTASPPMLASPFQPQDSLQSAIITDWYGDFKNGSEEAVNAEIAMRVPEVKAALRAHTSMVAPLKFEVFHDNTKDAEQPFWVANTNYPGTSPYLRTKGLVTDLYLYGWALLGAELDPVTDLPHDLVYIPRTFWDLDENSGQLTVDDSVPANFRQRYILISLGTQGLLTDGIDSIRKSRRLERAQQVRLDTPPAGTNIHISDPTKKNMTAKEKAEVAASFSENRRQHNVVVTVDGQEIKDLSASKVDLFESAMNSIRIQIANHAGVPASYLEAGKEGGSNGSIQYSNTADKNSELWLFGSSEYAYAIASRLSQSDVVGEDAEVRADLTPISFPAPHELDTEAPDVVAPQPAPEPESPTE